MNHARPCPTVPAPRRAVVAGALLALAAAGAGGAAFATFTGTTDASQSVDSGTVALAGIGTDGPGNRLTVGAHDIAAGDTIQRTVTLTNTGSLDLSQVRLTTVATTSSRLDTDAANGLRMTIARCSVPWTESATTPYTYTCAGTTRSALGNLRVTGNNRLLRNLLLAPGAVNHLRVTLTLPTSAGNAHQGQSSVISYTFTGTQRAATAR